MYTILAFMIFECINNEFYDWNSQRILLASSKNSILQDSLCVGEIVRPGSGLFVFPYPSIDVNCQIEASRLDDETAR